MHRGNIFLPYFFTFTKSAVILLVRNKKGLNQTEMRPRLINPFLANIFVGDFSGYKMGTLASNGLTTTHTRVAHLEIILLHIRLLSIIKTNATHHTPLASKTTHFLWRIDFLRLILGGTIGSRSLYFSDLLPSFD